ncbi:MAG: hypothetical protein HY329_18275 [Chloroflexi bacterium]|nr:hypothetical protein [Chloroflexota bacterium]
MTAPILRRRRVRRTAPLLYAVALVPADSVGARTATPAPRPLDGAGHSHSPIAAALGKAKSWVDQHLALLRLPKIVQRYVASRRRGKTAARSALTSPGLRGKVM